MEFTSHGSIKAFTDMTGAVVTESSVPGVPADVTAAVAGVVELGATEGGAPADRGDASAVSADAVGQLQQHYSGTTAAQHYPTHPHPRGYVAYRADPAPSINGRLDEACWRAAPWSDGFVDIEGPAKVCVCMPHVLCCTEAAVSASLGDLGRSRPFTVVVPPVTA